MIEKIQPVIDLLNMLLNNEEIDVSDVHQCLFIMNNLMHEQKTKRLANPNNFKLVTYENE